MVAGGRVVEKKEEREEIFNVNLIYQFRFSLGLAPYPLK
jgi:hypothetical protein